MILKDIKIHKIEYNDSFINSKKKFFPEFFLFKLLKNYQ